MFKDERFIEIINETILNIRKLSTVKGGEYAGNDDRLANFRRNAERLGLPMEVVWHTYCVKHWDAIETYIKDVLHDTSRPRSEPIGGRVDDMIVYLLLFKAICEDRGEDSNSL